MIYKGRDNYTVINQLGSIRTSHPSGAGRGAEPLVGSNVRSLQVPVQGERRRPWRMQATDLRRDA